MLLASVEYARPGSVEEALSLLGANPNGRALAGGQTLVNVMKARIAAPELLVDLNGIPGLREIRETDEGLELGPMVTYTQLARSEEVIRTRPILAEVAAQIADVQVRNRGTLGGNLCSNDPTNHLPPVLVAVGATMTVAGAAGRRVGRSERAGRAEDDQRRGQRHDLRARGRGPPPARSLHPGRPRPDRNARRLRHRQLRRLLGDRRRRAAEELHDAGDPGRRR